MKCAICMSKKGQRDCRLTNAQVCSLCCGQNRQPEGCHGCEYYKDAKLSRNYNQVPAFSTMEMEHDLNLQPYAFSIESILCLWDNSSQNRLKDESALSVLKMLLDKYFFHDKTVSDSDEVLQKGFEMVSSHIEEDITDISNETLYKIISVIHFVARRRTAGGREYLDFIQQYVGMRVAPGVRVLPNPAKKS